MSEEGEKTLTERAFERIDLRVELEKLEGLLNELRVQYEQYFMGVAPYAPDKLHAEVKKLRRRLMKAPFKNSEANFRLRALENRYFTYHTYWERVLRQREEGTYFKDIFKAQMREKIALEAQHAQSAQGAAEKQMATLFKTYRKALEKQTGREQNIDFKAFQKSLVHRAKQLKAKHGGKGVSFKVVVKNGKVVVNAKLKG